MELTEFKYLVDNGYITQVQEAGYYLDPANSEALKKLTEEELAEKNIITRVGNIAEAHTFEIKLVGEIKNPIIMINGEPRSIVILPHDTEIIWSVNAEGYKEKTGKYKLSNDHIEEVTLEQEEVKKAPVETKSIEEPVETKSIEEPVETKSIEEPAPVKSKSKTKTVPKK